MAEREPVARMENESEALQVNPAERRARRLRLLRVFLVALASQHGGYGARRLLEENDEESRRAV